MVRPFYSLLKLKVYAVGDGALYIFSLLDVLL